jgi:hypothetical protein
MSNILSALNYWAILVSGLAYWIIGSVWFSAIAGRVWSAELEKHGVKIKQPTKSELITKLMTTFVLNVLLAFGLAVFIYTSGIVRLQGGIKVGLVAGICFSFATIAIAYTWESRSIRLLLIDAGYALVGIVTASVILTLWR